MRFRQYVIICLLFFACRAFGQATLPVSRTTWSATPTGWTDNYGGQTYTSALPCDGNTNRAKLTATGHYTQVFFTGVPNLLSFDMQGNGVDAASSLAVQESPDGATWSTIATVSSISGSCTTYTYGLTCTSAYVKLIYTKSLGNISIDNMTISVGTCTSGNCPTLTGAILNSCDNGVAGCNEGDAEVMFFNSGGYSITVASLPTHVVNYYGSQANLSAGIINAYTGSFSSNASTTSTLNSSTGCSGSFIDAVTAGTIPAGATFMMVPSTFCPTNYDFSNLCSSFGPIYVLYFSTTLWNSSGNLANHQTPSPQPKFLQVNFASVSGSCGSQYYTFDADTEASGNGAGIAYPSSISTNSASPTSPSAYTSAGCALPIVLPIDLVEFKAVRFSGALARVSFSTESEINVLRYRISKSYDGSTYTLLNDFNAHNEVGEFHYCSYDDIADSDKPYVYYRLSETDYHGNDKLIANCVLEVSSPNEMSVYAYGQEVIIKSPGGIDRVEVYAVSGALVMTPDVPQERASYHFETRELPGGIYFISVTDAVGKRVVKKIVR